MIDFGLSEEQKQFRDLAHEFAEREIAPYEPSPRRESASIATQIATHGHLRRNGAEPSL